MSIFTVLSANMIYIQTEPSEVLFIAKSMG